MKKLLALFLLLSSVAHAQNTLPASTAGDMLWRNPSAWATIPGGTAGQFLQSQGPTAQPTWSNSFAGFNLTLPLQATNTVLGNVTGSTASPVPINVNQLLDTIGYDTARPPQPGSILVKEPVTGTWQALPVPTPVGWVLTSQGPQLSPQWTPAGVPIVPGAAGTCLVSNGVDATPSYQDCIGAGSLSATAPITFTPGTPGVIAFESFSAGGIVANATGGAALPIQVTPSAWLNQWCSGTSGSVPTATGTNTWGCTGSTGTGDVAKATSPTITSPVVSGGTIDNTIIGSTTAATATVTNLTVQQQLVRSGRVLSTLSGNQNDWTPSGTGTYANSSAVYVDGGAANRNITGLTGGSNEGRIVTLFNSGTQTNIILVRESGSSTAANRFAGGIYGDIIIPPQTGLELRYDGSALRWRPGPSVIRKKVNASPVFYLAPSGTGNDGNTCLASGQPCLTLNRVYNLIRDWYELADGQQAIIQMADGTYTAGLTANGPILGQSIATGVQIIGNTTTPTNVVLAPLTGKSIDARNGAVLYVRGMSFNAINSNTDHIYIDANSKVHWDTVDFGDNIGGYDIQGGANGMSGPLGPYTITKPQFTKTCATNATTTLTCADTSSLRVGMGVTTAAGTDFAPTTAITVIVPNTSVTINQAALTTDATETVVFSTGGLAHYQTDPAHYLFSSTSIGDGGANQIVVGVAGKPYYSNAFYFMGENARIYAPRVTYLDSTTDVTTTGTWTCAPCSNTIVVADGSGTLTGMLVVHPSVPWGTVISGGAGTNNLTLSANTTAAATASAIAFGTMAAVNALPFAISGGATLDSRQTTTTSDNSTLPGWSLTFNATFNANSNVITVSAGDATALTAFFTRFPGFRGLTIQGTSIQPGTVIPSSASISGTTVTVSLPTTASGSAVSLRAAGFVWTGAQLDSLSAPTPVPPINTLGLQSPSILKASAVQVSHTGDTNETTLATIAVPANAMGANGILRITTQMSFTGTNSKTPRIKFNGTTYVGFAATTQLSGRYQAQIANRNATNSQVGNSLDQANFSSNATGVITSAHDTTAAQNITITGQLTNTGETIVLESYLVEIIVP